MKLYKEASLMMLPTSVKDGKLYSIFPQPKPLSGELVTNGTFEEDASWNKETGWDIIGGKAVCDGTQTSLSNFRQNDVTVSSKIYKISLDIEAISGTIELKGNSVYQRLDSLGVGTHILYITADATYIRFTAFSGATVTIDNISVVEVDQAPADFDFSRGSNLAATRINEQGLIEKGRENLLLQSNQFDTTWTEAGSSGITTSGYEGYDGSDDAWQLEHKGGQFTSIRQTLSKSGVQTYSVYAKAGTLDYIIVYADSSIKAWFDLSTGTIGRADGLIDSSIEFVGNGWYRCTIVFNATLSGVRLYPNDANEIFGTTTGTIYIQDAQLEVGLVATDYIESGATTGKAGVLEDLPRLNWGGSCPSLLLEPSRSNYVPYSEKLDSNSHSGGTYIPNEAISPDGTLNAYGIDQDSGGNRVQPNIGAYDGLVTMSMYIKPVGTIQPRLNIYNASNGSAYGAYFVWDGSDFTINSYSLGYTDAGYEDVGNGWYRIWVVGTSVSGASSTLAQFRYNTDSDISNRLYVWGLQAERGSYPTSYIPTHGTSVTRAKDDIVEKADVGVTREDFTILFDIDLNNTVLSSNVRVLDLKDSSGVAQQEIRFFQFGGEHTFAPYFRQDSSYAFGTGDNDMRFDGRVIFRADGGGSYSMFFGFNGVSTKKVATGLTPYVLNKVSFLEEIITIGLKELTIWNTALSDNECINLTSI